MADVDSIAISKFCPKCSETKQAADFCKSKQTNDGLYGWCRVCTSERSRLSYCAKPDVHKARREAYYRNNTEKRRAAIVRYRESEAGREVTRAAARKRYRLPHKTINDRLRSGLLKVMAGAKAGRPSLAVIGCTRDELLAHFERQFTRGMGWHNMGEWHIDHIVPVSSFNVTDPDEVRRAWALPNLRPLWAADNIRKKDKRTHLI